MKILLCRIVAVLCGVVLPLGPWVRTTPVGLASHTLLGAHANQTRLAQVRYIRRGLSVQPPHRQMQAAVLKESLYQRYLLRTGAEQQASIRFRDGTTLHLNQRTDAVLSSPHLTVVQRGEIAQYLTPGTNHQIQTSSAVASAIGTTFVVLHGALQVANPAGRVVVTSNHESVVTASTAPSPPSPVNARAVFAWTSGIPTPDLGEDVALDANGGTIVGYSSQRQGPGTAGKIRHINDGLLSQGWESADGQVANQWVKIGFLGGNFYRLSAVIIDPAATFGSPANAALKDFQIRVSSTGTDDASFTTVFQGRCRLEDSLQRFIFATPVRARYVELVAQDNYGNPQRIAVAEWEVVANTSLFAQPTGIALDGAGNVYVADTNGNRIQKLSPRGKLLAAWGSKGSGPGQFQRPQGIAIDGQGHIYVADTYNHRIEELAPNGRFVGAWGSSGIQQGHLLFPRGLAIDPRGYLDVADDTGRIQQLAPHGSSGVWRTILPMGTLSAPEGLARDQQGHLWVADTGNDRLVELSAAGKVLQTMGAGGTIPGSFSEPTGIALARDGTLYVADSLHARVQHLATRGKVLASWGTAGSGRGQFLLPTAVALDRQGRVYVTDQGNSRVQSFSAAGKLQAVWGKYASIPQILGEPAGVAADGHGNIYVTDDLNDRVQQRDSQGRVRAVLGYHGYVARRPHGGLGQFWYPHGIAIDPQGAIYVADTFNNRIQILAPRGPIAAFGAPGQFATPEGVAADVHGNIYVADSGHNRVQKLSPRGRVLWTVGSRGTGSGQFVFPTGIAVARTGQVYVSDLEGDRIQKLSASGKVLAVWGQAGQRGTGALLGTSGRFLRPGGLAVDVQGNVYVADTGHNAVQKLSPDGAVLQVFEIPGPNAAPVSVTLDRHDNLYVADNLNSRIVKLAPTGEVLGIWD